MSHAYYTYVESEGERLFTVVSLPDKNGTFPIVIARSPYVDNMAGKTPEEVSDYVGGCHAGWNEAGDEVMLGFTFDEHAFVVKAGEQLRVDISSSAYGLYVPHTNNRGHFALQTTATIARNTVVLDKSTLTLPVE